MSNPINRIIVVFESPNGRYHGFRYIRCADGAMVEGQGPTESTVLAALGQDSKGWRNDYFWTKTTMKERELFALPAVSHNPEELRKWVENTLPAL